MEIKEEKVIRNIESGGKLNIFVFYIILVVLIIVGAGIGYFAGGTKSPVVKSGGSDTTTTSAKKSAGVMDKKKFPDSVEGVLKDGGIEGEGSFHLTRPGGESQNVYLTSSIVDLSQYIGKKIKVMGETQKAQKAGWLMDVGYVEVL